MLSPTEFQRLLRRLLLTPVAGLAWADRLTAARACVAELEARADPATSAGDRPPALEIVPFAAGRRPIDEALSPGFGASERVGLLHSDAAEPAVEVDTVWLLFQLHDVDAALARGQTLEVRMSAWFLPAEGAPVPVPGLFQRPVGPQRVSAAEFPRPALAPGEWSEFRRDVFVATLAPAATLLPHESGGQGYARAELDASLCPPDATGPFCFVHMFKQALRVELSLWIDGAEVGRDATEIEVFDVGRFGSLYARLLDRLVVADTQAQATRLARPELHAGFHPWFPALRIVGDRAALYLHAIRQDLAEHRRNLPDPTWLLRVGLYLELLTFLGIAGAVEADYPDLLAPAERAAFRDSPAFAAVRQRVDVAAWREVWALREVVPRTGDLPAAGPVALLNLRRKQRATLAFLRAHHNDLARALELAGPNLHDPQETWHRVLRDAERAVLRNSLAAFPELGHLEPRWRERILWHQHGAPRPPGPTIPDAIAGVLGDHDGLFAAACRAFRTGMNAVATAARARGLMEFSGESCIPASASLLEATLRGDTVLLAALQRRDGWGPLDLATPAPPGEAAAPAPAPAGVGERLRQVPVLRALTERELDRVAARTRRVQFTAHERVVQQGEPGDSLFVVAEGAVEVLIREEDGRERAVATLEAGAVFGEAALLTGSPRRATVRALAGAALFEIRRDALLPLIEARPQLVVDLALLMAARQHEARERQQASEAQAGLVAKIGRFFLGS